MTVVCLYRTDNFVGFASDGLSYTRDGHVVAHVTKIFPIPHLRAVFAHAGVGGIGTSFLDVVNRGFRNRPLDSFDELLPAFPDLCREALRLNKATAVQRFGEPIREADGATFIVAGWSDAAQRFVALKTSSFDKEVYTGAGGVEITPAWTVQPIENLYANHWPRPENVERFGLTGDVPLLDYLARIVCAGRADSFVSSDGVFCAGGALQMTVLDGGKIVSWIAHRWPDDIGRVVDPDAGEPMPPMPIMMP